MKVVLQNVLNCEVKIKDKVYSSIDRGFLLLVSFTDGDNLDIINKTANKISKLRVFMDENGKTNLSLLDVNGKIMSVSQFTLYADVKKGNRPSFTNCLDFNKAKELYQQFNLELKKLNLIVEEGVFGEDMKVSFVNDGPFTLVIDSKEVFK
ncbi:MAG: D-tyrosyl-tRNA(Tyr) deacylase [Firmicutes bacterium]|nr:D-tyrosyl-tRNA(Tyr) deacylase [Candidatus Alectryobacillus merdavium]